MEHNIDQWKLDYEAMLLRASGYSGNKAPGSKTISASSLTNDMLQLYLDFKFGKQSDTKFEASNLGSMYQLGIDFACQNNPQYISANRLTYELSNGWTLTGEIDQIDMKNKVIIDNKLSTQTALKKVMTEGQSHNYAIQLGAYKFLAHKQYNDHFTGALAFVDKSASYFKPTTGDTMNYLNVDTCSYEEIESLAISKTDELQQYLDNDIVPEKCSDLFPFKSKGYTRPMRCIYYCSYNQVCPYASEYKRERSILNDLEPIDTKINPYSAADDF